MVNKIIKFLTAASVLMLALNSCKEELLPPSITAEPLEISGDAGTHSLPYSIENYTESISVISESDAEWLVIEEVVQGAEGAVKFSVDANENGNARVANITISYGDAPELKVQVTQAPEGGIVSDVPFEIEVGSITPYSCTVTYTPMSYTGGYFFIVMDAEDFEAYLENDNLEGLVASDLEWLEYQADYNGMTLAEFLPRAIQVYNADGEESVIDYTDLSRDSDYYAYCYGLSADGVAQTEVIYEKFRTEIVETVDMTFTGRAEGITNNSAVITVEPSDDENTYYWAYVSEMDMANYDLVTIMDNMIQNLDYEASLAGVSLESLLCLGASSSEVYDLWAGTEYSVVAWGMDGGGTPTTNPQVAFTFETKADEIVDDCTFDVVCEKVEAMDILVHVTPSNPDTRYYIAVVDSSICVGYNDEQMAQRIINMEDARISNNEYGEDVTWANFPWLFTGEQELWAQEDLAWTFKPETMYQIYVFGINDYGERTTAVKRIDQRTAPADESDMTFEMEIVDAKWNMGTLHITPSNNDEYWLPFLIETDELVWVRNEDGSLNEDMLVDEIEHYYDNAVVYYLRKGEVPEYVTSWISGTDYTLLLCGWAGGNTTKFYEFRFDSPEIPFGESDAEMTATYELFDGADLYEMDPIRWEGYQEDCIMYIKFNPNENAVHWYGGVWGTADQYEDTGGIHHLMTLIMNPNASFVDKYSGIICPWFNYTWSFSYVAEGADGTFGDWHYEEFTPVRGENMSEPYDFWSNPANNAAIMSVPMDFQEKADNYVLRQSKDMIRNAQPAVIPQTAQVSDPMARTITEDVTAEKVEKESAHSWKQDNGSLLFAKSGSGRHHALKNNKLNN